MAQEIFSINRTKKVSKDEMSKHVFISGNPILVGAEYTIKGENNEPARYPASYKDRNGDDHEFLALLCDCHGSEVAIPVGSGFMARSIVTFDGEIKTTDAPCDESVSPESLYDYLANNIGKTFVGAALQYVGRSRDNRAYAARAKFLTAKK